MTKEEKCEARREGTKQGRFWKFFKKFNIRYIGF
jgi:hypothetical protein